METAQFSHLEWRKLCWQFFKKEGSLNHLASNCYVKERLVIFFRCLHRTGGCLPFQPNKCCEIETVCMCLHNLYFELYVPLTEEEVGDVMDTELTNNAPVQGAALYKRQQLIELFRWKCCKVIISSYILQIGRAILHTQIFVFASS